MEQACLLPFRSTLEQEGYRVYFDGKNRTALAQKPGEPDLFVDYRRCEAWIGRRRTDYQVHVIQRRIYIEAHFYKEFLT